MKPLLEIDSIRTLITAARGIVDELDADGLFPRLIAVVEKILPEDRDVLLDIIEHDVVARTLVDERNLWGRFKLHPNPFARLYHRPSAHPVHSMAYEESVRSARMGARMSMTVTRAADWTPNAETLAALARLSPEERACVVSVSTKVRDRLRARQRT